MNRGVKERLIKLGVEKLAEALLDLSVDSNRANDLVARLTVQPA